MDWVLYGVGSPYVYEVYESLLRLGRGVAGLVDNLCQGNVPQDLGRVATMKDIPMEWRTLQVALPLLTPGYRFQAEAQAREFGFYRFPSILDPTAVIASKTEIAEGVHVNAAATIGSQCRLEKHVYINRSASIGHHSVMEEYVSTGPGCIVCGHCVIGRGTFVGAGAIIKPKVHIGANAVIGAGAVVLKDIPPFSVVVGNPAKVVKTGISGYNDAKV